MIAPLFIIFTILLVLGIPVAISLSLAAATTIYFASDLPLLIIAQRFFSGINNFSYMSIPLFLLAGNIMAEAKISEKLVSLASLFVGRFTGGLAHVATGSSAFFGAVSGSSPATTAAIGSIMIPSMEEHGYDKSYSSAVVASSGILGNIIPPSLTMVVYGVTASVSIGSLFLAGIIPGLIITFALMILNYFICKKNNIPKSTTRYTFKEKIKIISESLIALLMPIIILGGIYSGMFTATESAAVACLYGIIVGLLVYRTLTFRSLFKVFKDSVENISMIFLLMAAASLFTYIIAREQLPQILASNLLSITESQTIIMFFVLAILLFLGTFLDSVGALVLIVPTLMEVITRVGIDPIYFGVFTVIALGVGMITPPVGLNLFVAANISKARFESIVKQIIPHILVYIFMLIIFIFFPGLLTLITM